jgi:hypothetical protein
MRNRRQSQPQDRPSNVAAVTGAAARPSGGGRPSAWVIVGLWVAAAFATYRPWIRAPFAATDYSEFLPLLTRERSATAQFRALNRHFLLQGRSHSLAHAFTVLNWQLFGWNPVGWQLLRCALMAGALIGAYALYVKLGVHRVAGALAVALFAWSSPAIYGWIRFNNEPIALIVLIAALWAADGYQSARRWPLRGAFIGLAIATIGLIKEVLISVTPVLIVLACCVDEDGRWSGPRLSRRNLTVLALAAGAAAAIAVRATVNLATVPPGEVYGYGYGMLHVSVSHALELIREFSLPVSGRESWAPHAALFPGNLLFLLVGVLGWWRLAASPAAGGVRARDVVLGVGLPALGVLAYLPWRKFDPFYPIPYLVGSGFLFARALCSLVRSGSIVARLGATAWVLGSMLAALTAQRRATNELPEREVGAAAAQIIGTTSKTRDVVVVSGPNPWGSTGGLGYRLREDALAIGYSEPAAVRDSACQSHDSIPHTPAGPEVVLVYVPPCRALPLPTMRIKRNFGYRDLWGLRFVTNSLMVDVFER